MEYSLSLKRISIKTILVDLIFLAAIVFLPALSHMFSFPFYLFEPMRILLIISIAYTSKTNSFIVAAALPVLSFALSTHPAVFKTFLILSELSLNVWLFFVLSKKFKNYFGGMAVSIILSKLFYYGAKFLMIYTGLIAGDLVSTPIYLQGSIGLVLSVYIYFVWKNNSAEV